MALAGKKSTELKTENQKKHNSTGLKNIQDRLNILNTIYKTNYLFRLKIFLPIQERV